MAGAPAPVDGVLVVDKPAGWTSHDVVARSRRLVGTRKVGHAGTLDPMATGVLVLGVGRATRLLAYLVGCDKEYSATVRLGQSTSTEDTEGEVIGSPGAKGLAPEAISAAVAALTGEFDQVPSAVSAIKVDGRRSYERVRAGEQVELAARPVTVGRFEVLRSRDTTAQDGTAVMDLDVEVEVSSGTYVRALARDLGSRLGTGGHLTALRRTRVGGFDLADAVDFLELDAAARAAEAARREDRAAQAVAIPHVLSLETVAHRSFATRQVSADEARMLGHGQRIPSEQPGRTSPVAVFDRDCRLIALVDESEPQARPRLVLAAAGAS